MTDREMLELAAKAAGIRGCYASLDEFPDWMTAHDGEGVYYTSSQAWNPRTDNGDALTLAIDLGLSIRVLEKCVYVETDPETLLGPSQYSALEMYGDDPYDATRRAIVSVAAEIGKGVK
jgi:hypothetical protein